MEINPLTAIDFYKADHRRQYPEGTTEVYSNFTARSAKFANVLPDFDNKVVFFGLQYFIRHFLQEVWDQNFFLRDIDEVTSQYKTRIDFALGKDKIPLDHIRALHKLGYLPLKIKAFPEGSRVPIGVPLLTMVNTHPDFFWLTNYLETALSCYLWKPITSATIAFEYKKLLSIAALKTGAPLNFVNFQAHDFSFRGMSGLQDAAMSGAAHLTSFCGTDSVPAIDFLCEYYDAEHLIGIVGCSVPATEHSVMCMGEQDNELETFRRLICEVYPKGIVSIVSDTWDFWRVVTEYVTELKSKILNREGKVVIRPDSGDPVKIICGDPEAEEGTPEHKGAVQCLWDVFGGQTNDKGFKQLDDHIGLIYGDSITLERAERILKGLAAKGFASSNVVLGIGSYTYQYVTRDTFGFAAKATSGVVNNVRRDIFKSPKTDSGTKKSAKGLLKVVKEGNQFVLLDQQTPEQEEESYLDTVFYNGMNLDPTPLSSIRHRLDNALKSYILNYFTEEYSKQ